MESDSGIERREYFRISDRLFIEYREVDHQESLVLEKGLKQWDVFPDPLQANTPVSGSAASPKNRVYAYLESIDRKLDVLIDLLSKKDERFYCAHFDIVISGSGLKFSSPVELCAGAHLELRIGLPLSPVRRVTALGRVIWSRPEMTEPGQAPKSWEAALTFASISEKDRDALISYVFSLERECLRTREMP